MKQPQPIKQIPNPGQRVATFRGIVVHIVRRVHNGPNHAQPIVETWCGYKLTMHKLRKPGRSAKVCRTCKERQGKEFGEP